MPVPDPVEPPKKWDAVLCPSSYPQAKTHSDQMIARNVEFGPVLGVRRVHSRAVPGQISLITREVGADQVMYFDSNHLLAGEERYVWTDRGRNDGVKYGVLRPEAVANPIAPPTEIP